MSEELAVPDGWTILPLSKCVNVLDHIRRPVNSKERATRIGQIPYYGATGQVGWIDDYIFDEELVLVGEDGAPFFDKSKPIAYIIDGKSWVNNHAHVLRAIQTITSNRYIKYYLDSFDFTGFVNGSTRDKLTQEAMNSIPVLLAPPDQQLALVELIDSLSKQRIDAVDHLYTGQRVIERFRQALLAVACSGRLTADWREAHSPYSYQNFSNLGSSAQPLTDTPDNWMWVHLKDIADVQGGIQKGLKIKAGESIREVPYLRVANVQRGWLDLTEIKTIVAPESRITSLKLEPGDILFNEGGDRDKLGRGWIWEGQIEECIHQNHVFRARLLDSGMQPRFYSWFGNSIGARYFIEQGKQTVNLASLSISRLKALPVPVPPLEEQAVIVHRVEQLLTFADHLQSRVEKAIQRVERSSQAVLAKAFRGELTTMAYEEQKAELAV